MGVSPHRARIAVLPRQVASEVITGAVSRAGWAVGIAILLMNVVVLIDMVGRRSGPTALFVPLLATVGILGLLALVGAWPSTSTRVLFLAAGGVFSTAYAFSLLSSDPSLNGDASHLVNRPAFVLVIAIAGVRRPSRGLLWGALGFAVGMSSVLLAELLAGVPLAPGWGPVVAFAIYASAYLILAGVRRSQVNTLPDLDRLEQETRRLALDGNIEWQPEPGPYQAASGATEVGGFVEGIGRAASTDGATAPVVRSGGTQRTT